MPLAQLFPSYRQLAQKVQKLEAEGIVLHVQAEELDNERRGLKAEVRRLDNALAEYQEREAKLKDEASQCVSLKFERDELRMLYDKIAAEKTALERELRDFRSDAEMRRERLWAPPGHVYSPITDPNDRFLRQTEIQSLDALNDRVDLPIDEPAQLRLLGWLAEQGSRFPFQNGPLGDWRYHTGNGHFGHADAALLFSMLLEYKPSRLIEIGCGFSSLLVMDVNDCFLGHSLEAAFFDPSPDAILGLLRPLDPYRDHVHARRSQEIPANLFAQLGRGDILSLETSHVAKTGSDVSDIFSRILPSLAPGVLVHVHDIYYPFEYPESWVVQDNRSWNEAYFLRAFLQYNGSFRVLFFNNLMTRKYPDRMSAAFPGLEETPASSIWLEKIA